MSKFNKTRRTCHSSIAAVSYDNSSKSLTDKLFLLLHFSRQRTTEHAPAKSSSPSCHSTASCGLAILNIFGTTVDA